MHHAVRHARTITHEFEYKACTSAAASLPRPRHLLLWLCWSTSAGTWDALTRLLVVVSSWCSQHLNGPSLNSFSGYIAAWVLFAVLDLQIFSTIWFRGQKPSPQGDPIHGAICRSRKCMASCVSILPCGTSWLNVCKFQPTRVETKPHGCANQLRVCDAKLHLKPMRKFSYFSLPPGIQK